MDQLTAYQCISEVWQSIDSSIVFNCCMKSRLINDQINKAENNEIQTMCDPKIEEIIESLKRSLPIQHHLN